MDAGDKVVDGHGVEIDEIDTSHQAIDRVIRRLYPADREWDAILLLRALEVERNRLIEDLRCVFYARVGGLGQKVEELLDQEVARRIGEAIQNHDEKNQ